MCMVCLLVISFVMNCLTLGKPLKNKKKTPYKAKSQYGIVPNSVENDE